MIVQVAQGAVLVVQHRRKVAALLAGVLALLMTPAFLLVMLTSSDQPAAGAPTTGTVPGGCVIVEGKPVPAPPGLTAEQSQNAATIIAVGKGLKIAPKGWVIATATALVESNLYNLDYGDRDSVGLFQQRTPWGSIAERTTPSTAA